MRDIAIYGGGGLGREVVCLINRINEVTPSWKFIGFFDDGKVIGEDISHFGRCLGGITELNNWPSPLAVVLCFGAPKTLQQVNAKISNPLVSFPNIIDPSSLVVDKASFRIGKGNIIQLGCVFSTNVNIGDFNLLNGSVSVGHDTNIGNYNVVMPGVKVSGEVSICDGNLIGSGSFIKQQLTIGNSVTLSPLSALLTRPKDNSLYIGNPAKRIQY